MASFEERVKAAATAMEPFNREGADYWTAKADKAIRAADATEPEIGAVRRWLAGETVDAATLPRMLSETIRALAEAQQVAERAQGGDAVRQWLDGAGVHEDALPKRLRMTLVELRCARKQRDEYSQRIAALLATDEPVTADPNVPRFSSKAGQRVTPLATLTREAREGAVAAVIHRNRSVQTAKQTAREIVRALDEEALRAADAARFEAQEAAREKAAPGPHPCEYCNHESGCGPRDGCDCAVCCHDPTPDDGGDVIDWKARALAAEAEDEARAQEVDQLRARIVELETEVAKLRAALERETAPRMWVGRMAGVEPCTRCGAKWVD